MRRKWRPPSWSRRSSDSSRGTSRGRKNPLVNPVPMGCRHRMHITRRKKKRNDRRQDGTGLASHLPVPKFPLPSSLCFLALWRGHGPPKPCHDERKTRGQTDWQAGRQTDRQRKRKKEKGRKKNGERKRKKEKERKNKKEEGLKDGGDCFCCWSPKLAIKEQRQTHKGATLPTMKLLGSKLKKKQMGDGNTC